MTVNNILIIVILVDFVLGIILALISAWIKRDTERMIDKFCEEERKRYESKHKDK